MRALCVGFAAADVVARVRGDPLPWPGATATFGLRLLGQTVPAGDHEGFCAAQTERTFTLVSHWADRCANWLLIALGEIPIVL